MGCEVYANGDEIACKAGDNKVIAGFPDVCLSPPSPPAGPVPVPYPNTAFSKDMQEGSKTVKIGGKEVMLKNQSYYKTSPLGDEAATNGLGASVITHVITGKTYCAAWSMDVKFEGQNVDRHTDITTSNHASNPGSRMTPTPTTAKPPTPAAPPPDPCKGVNCASVKTKIQNIKKEIAKRTGELHEDPQGLPWDIPGAKPSQTVKGHIKLLNEHKANLAKQKGIYMGCCAQPGDTWDSI